MFLVPNKINNIYYYHLLFYFSNFCLHGFPFLLVFFKNTWWGQESCIETFFLPDFSDINIMDTFPDKNDYKKVHYYHVCSFVCHSTIPEECLTNAVETYVDTIYFITRKSFNVLFRHILFIISTRLLSLTI